MALPARPFHSFRSTAFTLTELLIVLAILAIVALAMLPGHNDDARARLRSAARLLVADLEYAQIHSIGDAADPCVIVFDVALDRYWIARRSDPDTPIIRNGIGPYVMEFGSGRGAMLHDVAVAATDLEGDDQLGFTALGTLDQGADATIVLRAGTRTVTVVIDASTGEPRLIE